jgi:hypothetical protein
MATVRDNAKYAAFAKEAGQVLQDLHKLSVTVVGSHEGVTSKQVEEWTRLRTVADTMGADISDVQMIGIGMKGGVLLNSITMLANNFVSRGNREMTNVANALLDVLTYPGANLAVAVIPTVYQLTSPEIMDLFTLADFASQDASGTLKQAGESLQKFVDKTDLICPTDGAITMPYYPTLVEYDGEDDLARFGPTAGFKVPGAEDHYTFLPTDSAQLTTIAAGAAGVANYKHAGGNLGSITLADGPVPAGAITSFSCRVRVGIANATAAADLGVELLVINRHSAYANLGAAAVGAVLPAGLNAKCLATFSGDSVGNYVDVDLTSYMAGGTGTGFALVVATQAVATAVEYTIEMFDAKYEIRSAPAPLIDQIDSSATVGYELKKAWNEADCFKRLTEYESYLKARLGGRGIGYALQLAAYQLFRQRGTSAIIATHPAAAWTDANWTDLDNSVFFTPINANWWFGSSIEGEGCPLVDSAKRTLYSYFFSIARNMLLAERIDPQYARYTMGA